MRSVIAMSLLALLCSSALAKDSEFVVVDAFRLDDVRESPSDSEASVVEVTAGKHELTVVCFLGTECPLAKLYATRLRELAGEFTEVQFIGVNSNVQDSVGEVAEYAKRHQLSFPMVKDHENEVADQFEAVRTPEVFVLDEQLAVRYRGRIDDQYMPGVSRKSPTRNELREAIVELRAGKAVTTPHTEAVGCFIGRVKKATTKSASSDVTYCKQVSRILQERCVECHREGEIGPFQLEEYDEVVGWADTILEVIDDGRMPPWHANPEHGEFVNARLIPKAEKELLQKWVDAGMPYGDAKELPEPAEYTSGWRLDGEPDMIVEMCDTAFEVPADGTVEYQYFVVDPKFEEDKWITGAQIIPGNPSVVHHSIAFVRPPDGARFRGIGWLTAYVPGARNGTFPKDSAVFVPAGSKFVFQQHYTPNGTDQSDITKMGITFADDKDITHEVYTVVGIDQEFEIPPNTADHKVSARVGYLPRDAELLSINPHMHLRGKTFRCFAEQEDGERALLLDVPNYDFNWQHTYRLKHPIPLSQLDKIEFDVTFDNSEANPVNPDPTEYVSWGDQTWEEMAVAFFEVKEPREKPKATPTKSTEEQVKTVSKSNEVSPEKRKRMQREADRILSKFDENKDGLVTELEAPFAFRRVFWQIDKDRDKKLSRSEIEEAARHRVN